MKKNYFILMIVLGFFSCQKEMSYTTPTTTEVDVYVAGYEVNGSGVGVAKYWKNGQAIALTDGTKDAWANSIAVVGSDVYVAGSEITADRNSRIAKYWKNGNPVSLNDASKLGATTSIAVSGGDVYVAGYLNNPNTPGDYGPHAVYWKNGNPIYLPENTRSADWADQYPISSKYSLAYSIFISGADIYIAGGEGVDRETSPYSGISSISAVYWKNGNEIYLIKGPYGSSHADEAYSIFVAGQDVYACGGLDAQYWKNGIPNYLNASPKSTTSICVSNGDVYVAGYVADGQAYQTYFGERYRYVAKYWKNGDPVNLSDGTKNAYPTSIAVSGSDVYVAGNEEKTAGNGDDIAKYWKNGNPVILGDVSKYSEAYSIFLVKK